MKTFDFDYELPKELIANNPPVNREEARLMVLHRDNQTIEHRNIHELPTLLTENDVLVFNNTRVFPARLKSNVDGKATEILLHREKSADTWESLVRPGKRFKEGTNVKFGPLTATVTQINEDGSRNLTFSKSGQDLSDIIDKIGETPLPPYIKNSSAPAERYQTVYADQRGSVAAPTAGLHFTAELLKTLKNHGIEQYFVTLHVGRGTFEPVKSENIEEHIMHEEWFELTQETVDALNHAKLSRKRIIAVGTTTNRVLEACSKNGHLVTKTGTTNLFITPGYKFQFVDALLTNFHLPKSTLLMLVSALAGIEFIQRAYKEAIQQKYRFYSFGDAMLIL